MSIQKKPVLRRCVGCGEMKDKKDLIRVVRTQEGEILPDLTGRLNGRGAYICKVPQCLMTAVQRKGLERSLRCRVDAKVYEDLSSVFAGEDS